jgi:hypothetical protein
MMAADSADTDITSFYIRSMLYHELSPETITDPKIRQVYAYWQNARRGRVLPSRADMDPLDLRFCLGWICLIDVIDGPVRRFRFRLDGSRLADLTGYDLTNQYVDEMKDPAYAAFLSTLYNRAVDTREAIFIGDSEDWGRRGYLMQSATLPLSDDGEHANALMDVLIPTYMPRGHKSVS